MKTLSVSRFKATCLQVLEEVRVSGRPVLVTKRGAPLAEIVPPSRASPDRRRLGLAAGTVAFVEDIVPPALTDDEWEALFSQSSEPDLLR